MTSGNQEDDDGVSDDLRLLVDTWWEQIDPGEAPPLHAVIGMWAIGPDGLLTPFEANDHYRSRDEESPADPLEAVMRVALESPALLGQLLLMLRHSVLHRATTAAGRPLTVPSPDGTHFQVAVTSESRRAAVDSPEWCRLDLFGVVSSLPDGVDVLVNPGSPCPMKLSGELLRQALVLSPADELLARRPWVAESERVPPANIGA